MNERLSSRLTFMGFVVVGLFSALFIRLWYLQILTHEELTVEARENQIEVIVTPPTRGRILDRHGVVLADNRRIGVVTVDKSRYAPGELDVVLAELSELLDIDDATLRARLNDNQTHPLAAKVVAADLDEEGLLRISERSLPGVTAQWQMQRTYPLNEVGAHVLGYVGALPARDVSRFLDNGYLLSERVGRAGVELLFETFLHGTPGITQLEVDSQGRVHRIIEDLPAEPGEDIVLTIDSQVQAATESYLRQGLLATRKTVSDDSGFFYPAIGGAAVVMDLRNGDVLAMASHPTYDPNWLVDGISGDVYRSVFENDLFPGVLNNRAVQGLYSPGSTFKTVTALGGLEAGLISPRAAFYDLGYYTIPEKYNCSGRCTFYNADRLALGVVDLSGAMTRSSDAYFYQVGNELWHLTTEDRFAIQHMARELGFSRQTGIQLPFEKSGRIPDDEVKRTLFESNPEAYNPYGDPVIWLPGDNINTAIGQGMVAVTPIQLANAYATLANGGTLFAPNIVDRRVSRSAENLGEVVQDYEPRIMRTVEFPPGTSVVVEGLNGITSFTRRGTAWQAFQGYPQDEYCVAGKTGTSQADGINPVLQRKKEDTALFVAWAPCNDPRYVVAVVMEEAGFGGQNAAPVARQIIEAVRAYEQRWPEPQIAFVPPQPECPEIPEALRGEAAFLSYVPEGCPWGIPIPRANREGDADGDGVPDTEQEVGG